MSENKKSKPKTQKTGKYSLIYEWHKKKKLSKNPKEIIKDIKGFEVKILKQHPGMDENEVTDLAIGRFFAANKKRLSGIGADEVLYYLFKDTGPFDWVAARRAKALAKYDKDPDDAVNGEIPMVRLLYNEMGEVVKIIPLYSNLLNRTGKPNKKLGEDLPEHGYLQSLGGICILKSDFESVPLNKIGKFIKKLEILNSGDLANEKSEKYINVNLFNQWGITNLKITENDKKYRVVRTNTLEGTSFDELFMYGKVGEQKTLNVSKRSILSFFKNDRITLKGLDKKFLDNLKVKGAGWTRPHSRGLNKTFLSEVFVSAIDPGNDQMSPSIAVASPEMGMIDEKGNEIKPIKVWWNNYLPLDFGEGSKIALFYRMAQSEIKDGEKYTGDYGSINFNVQGVIVLHKEEVKIRKQKKEPKKEATGVSKIDSEFDEDDIIENDYADMSDEELEDLENEANEAGEEEETEPTKKTKTSKKTKKKPVDELDAELEDAFTSEDGFSEDELFDDL